MNDSSKSSEKIQSVTEAAGDVNNNKVPGAQTSVQSITATYTLYDIKIAASRVKAYIESNKKLPDYVQVGTRQVTMPQFLKLLTAGLLKVKSGSNVIRNTEKCRISDETNTKPENGEHIQNRVSCIGWESSLPS